MDAGYEEMFDIFVRPKGMSSGTSNRVASVKRPALRGDLGWLTNKN